MADNGDTLKVPSPAKPNSLFSDLKDIWTKSGTLATLVQIPALGLNAYINSVIDPYRGMAEIVVLTAPFCVSVTILAMLTMRGWFKDVAAMPGWGMIFLAFFFPYVIAVMLGVASPRLDPSVTTPTGWHAYNPIMYPMLFVAGILQYYVSAYGLGRMISSTIFGCSVAWIFQYKLLPMVRRIP